MSRLTLAACLLAAAPLAAQDTNVVVTVGEALVQRAPDRAYVMVAAESRAKNPRDAQRQNAEAMTAVLQRLAALGVTREAIRTVGIDLRQEFDYQQGRPVPREYVARNTIEVRVDEIAKAGEVLDAAVQAGASAAGGIRFDLKDRAGAEQEALRLAVVDARGRAEAAASGASRSIDRIVKIEDARETPIVTPRPMMAAARAEASPSTPIDAGVIDIRARVTLTASLK